MIIYFRIGLPLQNNRIVAIDNTAERTFPAESPKKTSAPL
jgi:hypothetical protein